MGLRLGLGLGFDDAAVDQPAQPVAAGVVHLVRVRVGGRVRVIGLGVGLGLRLG